MAESILTSTKAALDVPEAHTAFDVQITLFVNSVLSRLAQLGVGPSSGYRITDKTQTWEDFMGDDPRLNSAKSYMFLRVRMMWDPPEIGFVLTAFKEQIKEEEWRLVEMANEIKFQEAVTAGGGTPDSPVTEEQLVWNGGTP